MQRLPAVAPRFARSLSSRQVRFFNLPRPSLHASWMEPTSKEEFFSANAVPLRVKVTGFADEEVMQGKALIQVDGQNSAEFEVSADVANPGAAFQTALVQNLIWSTMRTWSFNEVEIKGVKVTAPTQPLTGAFIVTVDCKDFTPALVEEAKKNTTLLQIFPSLAVNFVQGAASGETPVASDTFLADGLAAMLACQKKFYPNAKSLSGLEFEAEMNVDTRAFMADSPFSAKAKSVFFRATAQTGESIEEVKKNGAVAESQCKILGGLKAGSENVATRWARSL